MEFVFEFCYFFVEVIEVLEVSVFVSCARFCCDSRLCPICKSNMILKHVAYDRPVP
jgi:hypothetical protein